MKIIRLIILFTIFSSCSSTNKRVPKDFSITIKESYEPSHDFYDSNKNEYERSYTSGIKKIKARLSEEDKDSILTLLKESDFFNFPNIFEPIPNSDGLIETNGTKGTTISISVMVNAEYKTVIYNSQYKSEEYKLRTAKFRNLTKQIWAIIQNKSEVKNLNQSDWNFM